MGASLNTSRRQISVNETYNVIRMTRLINSIAKLTNALNRFTQKNKHIQLSKLHIHNRNILNQLNITSSDNQRNLAKHMMKTKKNFKLKQQHLQAKHEHREVAETQTQLNNITKCE